MYIVHTYVPCMHAPVLWTLPLEDHWWPSKCEIWGFSSRFRLVLTYRTDHSMADIYNT